MASRTSAATVSNPPLDLLKSELETDDDSVFEHLSAHLISRLLGDVAITVSKSGYQVGADAGTAGLRGRRLRIECKRYKESTGLRSRDLAGEVAESADDDELLEAWVLMATKKVKENERKLAFKHGQKNGIAVIVIDWTPPASGAGICALAALCATWPDVVEQHLGKKAADAARALVPLVGPAVDNLRKDLEVWNIGYKCLREVSHNHLKSIWESRRQSRAYLGQDAAGGAAGVHLISRKGPISELISWWKAPSQLEAPVAVTGLEGVGKTWVALDWARQSCDELPIVLVLPSGAFAKNYDVSVGGIQSLLANTLKEHINSTLTERYWRTRVTRLLARPVTEGPTFFLFLDGLNQHPHTDWTGLAQTLQADHLLGRLRLLITCRQSYFEQDLRRLSRIAPQPVEIRVRVYDDTEFEDVLRLHGMSKQQLHESLRQLARTPRLFPLVHRLKDNDALKSDATVHRLLFEYGRDVLEQRERSAFTPDDWAQWLANRARHHRDRIKDTGVLVKPEPVKEIESSLGSPALTPEGVQRRLSELVDGHLFEKRKVGATTQVLLRNEAVVLGLALALLETLDNRADDFDAQQAGLEEWVEPISAIDQTTEVLRAALSVIAAGAGSDGEIKTDCLLVSWMNVQNPGQTYEQDAAIFGNALPRSMLAVVERSSSQARGAARHVGIQSLRKLSRLRVEDWHFIARRLVHWAGWFYVPRRKNTADPKHYAERDHDQIVERIGTALPGEKVVLGVRLLLDYQHRGDPASAIPGILEGHDVTQFPEIFRTAAVREAAQVGGFGKSWPGFHWLAAVASADEQNTREFLSQLADAMLATPVEPGVHSRLCNRAAALLLRLCGDESMEKRASEVNESFGVGLTYENDYEKDPAHSFFESERRHLESILATEDLPIWRRLEKANDFLSDPTVKMPRDILAALALSLDAQTFEGVHQGLHQTSEDHHWEKLQPVAARFLPTQFAEASRRQLQALAARRGEQKYWSALHLEELLLVVAPEDVPALSGLRIGTKLENNEDIANTFCLQLEILHMPVELQLEHLFNAGEYRPTLDLLEVLRPASAEHLGKFLKMHQPSPKAERLVLEVMAQQRPKDAAALAEKLLYTLDSEDEEIRNISFMALSLCGAEVCGQRLLSKNWKADAADAFAAHYGSDAVAHASKTVKFEDVQGLIAPWRWLDAAVARGSQPLELQSVSVSLVRLVLSAAGEIAEPPGEFSWRSRKKGELPSISVRESKKQETSERDIFRTMEESAEETDRRMVELSNEAAASIRKIRASGYSFYLQSFDPSAVRAAYSCAPTEWNKLLDGAPDRTSDFVRRVHSAEGLYIALCEVLLELAPAQGAVLWEALGSVARTKMKGTAGISEFIHMVFRAPDSPEVERLRQSLTSFALTSTDLAILDIVIAAQVNNRDGWLDKLIQQDRASAYQWRQKRGLMLDAFRSYPDPQTLDWPFGAKVTSIELLASRMAKWHNRGALARLWWSRFVKAVDAPSAFAAWNVFLTCADRRAYVWMKREAKSAFKDSELDRLRKLHVRMNCSQLERKLSAREEKTNGLNNHLFGREAPAHWLEMDAIAG
jgi:hypothetical protein